ncbi:MAG: hypothetical protein KGJ34_02645 [Patescibacteria group bacterium]|nr:hypothetical protein [Patescibacteria group bacterium]
MTSTISIAEILWIFFDISFIVSVLMTLAFYYHWGKYSPTHASAIGTMIVYTAGVVILLISMLGVVATI